MKVYKSNMKRFRLASEPSDFQKTKITCSEDGYKVIKQFFHDDINIYESFFILLLNRANNTVGYAKISQGGVAGTVADPKIIAKFIADSLCSTMILAHNHPSGNLKPSQQDIDLTKKIKNAANYFDCSVIDHLILAEDGYYSFADDGML